MAKKDDVELEVESPIAPPANFACLQRKSNCLPPRDRYHAGHHEARTSPVRDCGRRTATPCVAFASNNIGAMAQRCAAWDALRARWRRRRLLPKAHDPTCTGFCRRSRDCVPFWQTAAEVCPTEPAVLAWCAQMGTITFHPWPVRRTEDPSSVDKPDELRIDLDPEPGTTFRDVVRVALAAGGPAERVWDHWVLQDIWRPWGVHVFVRIKPDWDFIDVRHAAIAFGRELERRDKGVTTEWWKELRGERVFVDYNQNCRDRTIAAAWSPRSRAGAPVSTPVTWTELQQISDPP